MPHTRVLVVLFLGLVLAGCGEDDNGSDAGDIRSTETTAPSAWSGPPQPAEDGTIAVAGFNEYAETLPDEQRVPRKLALEFVQLESSTYDSVESTRPGGTTVTLHEDNLEDDSVRARRYTLEFALVTHGAVNLSSARVEYRCQPNRGHQEFSAEPCL
jgi:hypothetical protein